MLFAREIDEPVTPRAQVLVDRVEVRPYGVALLVGDLPAVLPASPLDAAVIAFEAGR